MAKNIERYRQPGCQWRERFRYLYPDPKLGSAIVAKARGYDMKVIAVDDQFVNAKGKPMDTVPLVMMAATKIGERQGQELYKEMQKRGWDVKESAVMAITSTNWIRLVAVLRGLWMR